MRGECGAHFSQGEFPGSGAKHARQHARQKVSNLDKSNFAVALKEIRHSPKILSNREVCTRIVSGILAQPSERCVFIGPIQDNQFELTNLKPAFVVEARGSRSEERKL